MLSCCRVGLVPLVAALSMAAAPLSARAGPQLDDPSAGTLELVTLSLGDRWKLDKIDGLAFDSFGNLFGALEVPGLLGGVVHIDKFTGEVTRLAFGIPRADQIALHPSGDLLVTSEVRPPSTSNRLFRVSVEYDADRVPVSASRSSIGTSLALDNPEGLVVLEGSGDFGLSGDAIVAEDRNPGRILVIAPDGGHASVLVSGLRRPEGLAFGDFAGARQAALYAAETSNDNLLRVDPQGAVAVLGNPAAVGLRRPDNLEFGPDGFLYVTEDRPAPNSRIVRVAADGTHSVFATGFGQAAGLAFDPASGDLYIAEQDLDRVWRVRFHPALVRIERLLIKGRVREVVCAACSLGGDDALEDGDLELRARDPGNGSEGGGRVRAELELEFESGAEIELQCETFGSFSYHRELFIGQAECTLSEGHGTTDACARFVVRPAGGTWDVFVESSTCDASAGRETLRISGALRRFEVRYEKADD